MEERSRLVYDSAAGRVNDRPTKPRKNAKRRSTPAADSREPNDGIVRIHRSSKGRKGKGVCLIKGIPLPPDELKALAKKLKRICGTGGAVKTGVIEIQGDQRDRLKMELEKLGFSVKLAGG